MSNDLAFAIVRSVSVSVTPQRDYIYLDCVSEFGFPQRGMELRWPCAGSGSQLIPLLRVYRVEVVGPGSNVRLVLGCLAQEQGAERFEDLLAPGSTRRLEAPPRDAQQCVRRQMRCATIRDQKTFEHFVETLHIEMTSTTNDPLLEPNRDYFVQQWAGWFASHGVSGTAGRVFIAEDPKSVGFVAALVSQAPFGSATVPFVGLVGLWWVEARSRGRGLGRQLLLAAEGWFKERGVRYAEANYLAENAGAADRWRRHGFVPYLISARKDLSDGDDAERLGR